MFCGYFVSVLGRETLEDHSQLPKKASKCKSQYANEYLLTATSYGADAATFHQNFRR